MLSIETYLLSGSSTSLCKNGVRDVSKASQALSVLSHSMYEAVINSIF